MQKTKFIIHLAEFKSITMKKIGIYIWLISVLTILFSACQKQKEQQPKIKYVFLFIGDGMGLNQAYISDVYLKQQGYSGISFLNFNHIALTTTNCADTNKITDSGAGGTAISTGRKTQFHAIGMNRKTGEKYPTIAEIAKKNGWKVGIITSVGLNHATPACFYAHVPWRNMYNEISHQMWRSHFDFFGGGGIITQGNRDSMLQIVWDSLRANGYNIVLNKENFSKAISSSKRIFMTDTQSLDVDNIYYQIDSLSRVSLADFTDAAIKFLNNDKGFFIMVEGGKIDWASHANDITAMIYETLDFDKAIRRALEFYNKHPKETIIIVTADHETGGLSYGYNLTKYNTYFDKLNKIHRSKYFLTNLLSKTGAETYAFAPIIKKYVQVDYSISVSPKTTPKEFVDRYIDSVQHSAGISWTTHAHTGTMIPTYAIGPGTEVYNGVIDNTFTFGFLLKSMKLKQENTKN